MKWIIRLAEFIRITVRKKGNRMIINKKMIILILISYMSILKDEIFRNPR